jgi:glycosyltransferase involved in cell wall biosynthesis
MPERRLRVLFDAHAIGPHRSGIGQYALHLCRALLAHCADRVALHLDAGGGVTSVASDADIAAAVSRVRDGDLYAPRRQWEAPLRARGFDVFHAPDFALPLLVRGVATVATVHDVVPLALPSLLARSTKTRFLAAYRLYVRRTVRRADAVLTDSAFSRDEIVRLAGGRSDRIAVVPLAPMLARADAPLPADAAAFLRGRPYLLVFGRPDPYKGLPLLFRALARANAGRDERLALVSAGTLDPRYDPRRDVAALGLGGDVHCTGYVDDASLSALLAGATALVHPSLYEGFGLPPLEAMAHGVPVVSSGRASLPEVTGDAALVADPEDPEAFAAALVRIATDATLRANLSAYGRERAGRFSWRRTATETLAAYERAVARHRSR